MWKTWCGSSWGFWNNACRVSLRGHPHRIASQALISTVLFCPRSAETSPSNLKLCQRPCIIQAGGNLLLSEIWELLKNLLVCTARSKVAKHQTHGNTGALNAW